MVDHMFLTTGGIVTFKWEESKGKGSSWRFEDATMRWENSSAYFHVNGYTLYSPTAEDGIGLTPDFKYVYYTPLASVQLYRVSAEELREVRVRLRHLRHLR